MSKNQIIDPFKEIAAGLSKEKGMDIWEEKPVDIETFVCDKEFLNLKWNGKTGCRPKILEILKEVARDEIREAILLLGKGSGKDFLASIMHLYGIYKALCMYDPQSYYGLAPGSPIYLVNVARNEGQAKNVFFTQFLGMLDNCLWFRGKHESPSSNTVKFDKRIRALSGNSQAFGWLGYNTIQWVGDELAFFLENDNNEESESKAEECWEAAFGSCQTRFPKHYKMFGITTPRYDDDFVMKKGGELQGREDGYFVQAATWDIHPNLTKEDFKHSLVRNYRRAMRDFGAMPMGVIESFWSEPEFVEENVCQICRECSVYQNRESNTDDYVCRSHDACRANGYIGNGIWRDWFKPEKDVEYFLHFDLSKNKDRLSFTLSHVCGFVKLELDIFDLDDKKERDIEIDNKGDREIRYEERPMIKVDALGWIDPRNSADSDMLKNREIHYHGIFNKIIMALINKGFKLMLISFDQYQCLVGSTLINTSRGILQLRDVMVGDIVPTRIGPRKVEKIIKYFNAHTIKIITKSDNVICGTHNHRIEVLDKWVQEGDRKKPPNPRKYFWKWKALGDIVEGDVVRMSDTSFSSQVDVHKYRKMKIPNKFTNTTTKRYNNVKLPEVMHEDFAELLGIIWGDGNFQRKGDVVSITGTSDEIKYVEYLVERVFNFKLIVNIKEKENCAFCQWSSKLLGDYFRANNIFKKPYDKRLCIPEAIMRSPKNVVGAFLRGIYSADGTVDKNDGSCTLITSSFRMAKQVKYVMQMKFGIRSTISRIHLDGSDSCFGKYGTIYHIKTTGSRMDFYVNIGFCYNRKESILKKNVKRPGRNICEKVEKIVDAGLKDVYDLAIEEDHSYVANGFISHNSLYMKQQVEDLGIESELLSTDRTDDIPVAAKRAFVENRVEYPYCRILCSEAKKLKYVKGKKVDHPEKGCFVGTQKVQMLDGRELSFVELVKEYGNGKKFWVYGIDPQTKEVTPAVARNPRHTKTVEKYARVTLDNGRVVRCTLEHPFLLRNGKYLAANKLKQGDSLMPLYLSCNAAPSDLSVDKRGGVSGGYLNFRDLSDGNKLKYVHLMVAKNRNPFRVFGNCVVHHKNFNSWDNRPENLEIMGKRKHEELHVRLNVEKAVRKNPDYKKSKFQIFVEKLKADAGYRELICKRHRATEENLLENMRGIFRKDWLWRTARTTVKNNIENQDMIEARNKLISRKLKKSKFDFSSHMKGIWKSGKMVAHIQRITGKNHYAFRDDLTIENISRFCELSVERIAKKLNTSKATILRRIISSGYSGICDLRKSISMNNHKVLEVKIINKTKKMYDITVEPYSNFALAAGVFVHNSKDCWDSTACTIHSCERFSLSTGSFTDLTPEED